ncbi:MAG: M56 family metallopeptidase [Deltaproteobacteria bacterium]|nr:M56 family metallopeptidase [Deltaproteobacteria bacterium]
MSPLSLVEGLAPVFDRLLQCGWQASVLIVVALLLRFLLRGRFEGRWWHAMWLLVFARLALPWAPSTALNPLGWLPTPASASPLSSVERTAVEALSPSMAAAPRDEAPPRPWPARQLLGLLWLAGAMVMAAGVVAGVVRFWWAVSHERLVTDHAVLELLEDCKAKLGVRTVVGVVASTRISGPALFGFVRPRILLPAGFMQAVSPDELRHVLLHELAHLKRADVLAGWFACLVHIAHWWNPLVWLAQQRMRADRELACDAMALRALAPGEPQAYGDTVIRLLERFAPARSLPTLTGILEDQSLLKRRITMIARFDSRASTPLALALPVLAVMGFLALTDGRAAAAAPGAAPQYSTSETFVIRPGQGIDSIAVGATVEQVERVFGKATPESRSEGKMIWLNYRRETGVDLLLTKEGRVHEIRFNKGFAGRLANGIQVGSSLDEVLAKSGGAKKSVEAGRAGTHANDRGADRVLYKQVRDGTTASFKFVDAESGILYWFGPDQLLTQIVVFAPNRQ